MELQNIIQMMIHASRRIEKATNEIHKMAREKAETEYEYRQALSIEIMKLKAKGVQATLIPDVARGNVAELKLARDLADGKYKSSVESLRALQSELNGLQTISRYQSEV
ncbi:hypothetical protein [Oceanobacillus kimchii]|uniref:hypothetical protein n=1 Tax=Oceanobacillus kimchii TaxID=746691 RepID=UPI000344A13D|nr:hypothetical protein [Oceanobacillus kimchii]